MLISALLALLSALNFAMLYQYILQKRRKRLAVFRICGCTKWKAFRSYIGECMAISIPAYAVGTAVFGMLLENVFDQMFPYMKAAYSPAIYLSIFAIYAAIVLVVLSVLILSSIKKQIA
jgi:predicted lysophospholipase L1 biosynthesis ABC-type transport system permease subunit